MAKLLTDASADRLLRLFAALGGEPAQRARGGVRGWLPVLAVANSATAVGGSAVGDQCFDASVVVVNSLDSTQDTGADVWLTVLDGLGSVVTPTADAVYAGVYAGMFDPGSDERLRVFAARGGGSLPDCYGGTSYTATAGLSTFPQSPLTVPRGDYLVIVTAGMSYGAAATIHYGIGMSNEGATPASPKVPTTLTRHDASSIFQTVTFHQMINAGECDDDGGTANVDITPYFKQTIGTATGDVKQMTAQPVNGLAGL